MKSLFFGIFAIIVIAVLFFTFQVVKSPTFGKLAISKTTSKQSDSQSKRFVDIQKGFSFEYPAYGNMVDPKNTPGYAPVMYFQKKVDQANGALTTSYPSNPAQGKEEDQENVSGYTSVLIGTGYIAMSQNDLVRLRNVNEEIIEYSEGKEIKGLVAHFINKNATNGVSDRSIEIISNQARRLTFKGGSNGAIIPFSARLSNSDIQDASVVVGGSDSIVEGNMYLYERAGQLSYGVSLFVPEIGADINSDVFREAKATFLNNEAEKIMQSMQFLN